MPEISETLVESPVFSAKAVRRAFQALEPTLGQSTLEALIHDLEMYGLPLVNGRISYSMHQIKSALEKIFGNEAAVLIYRHVMQRLLEKT